MPQKGEAMDGKQVSDVIDKVSEKLGVAADRAGEAFNVLAAEYQARNIVLAIVVGAMAMLCGIASYKFGRMCEGRDMSDLETGWPIIPCIILAVVSVVLVILCGSCVADAASPNYSMLRELLKSK